MLALSIHESLPHSYSSLQLLSLSLSLKRSCAQFFSSVLLLLLSNTLPFPTLFLPPLSFLPPATHTLSLSLLTHLVVPLIPSLPSLSLSLFLPQDYHSPACSRTRTTLLLINPPVTGVLCHARYAHMSTYHVMCGKPQSKQAAARDLTHGTPFCQLSHHRSSYALRYFIS